MLEPLEKALQQWLRVPSEPEAPAGSEGSVKVFRAARGFFHYGLLSWGVRQAFLLFGIGVGLISVRFMPLDDIPGWDLIWLIELLTLAGLVLQMPVTFLLVALDYRYRWYLVTDRSLRIREGIWQIQERTMTFSNIQNISIRQGPIQRFFGIADLEVRSAGGGGQSSGAPQHQAIMENLHVGYFRGVDDPEEIRDIILRHLRQLKASGLGDPDEPVTDDGETEGLRPQAPVLAAARELLGEVRRLRVALPASRAEPEAG